MVRIQNEAEFPKLIGNRVSRWNSVRNSLISSAEGLVKFKLAEIPRTASGFLN